MKKSLKHISMSMIRALGFNIERLSLGSDLGLQLTSFINLHDESNVIAVGENIGWFGLLLRGSGYKKEIISFEPLSGAHAQLCSEAINDDQWFVHERCATGSCCGTITITINVSEHFVSSSILSVCETHLNAAPEARIVGTERSAMYRLDDINFLYVNKSSRILLKIDTQGFEEDVLDGADEILSQCIGVLCEVSFVELYKGQRPWFDLVRRLDGAGFSICGMHRGFCEKNSGQTLQADVHFASKEFMGSFL